MSTQAQDRFNAAGKLFLAAIGDNSAWSPDVASIAGMARAAFERAEEINRQLFAEIQIRVSKEDATAALLAELRHRVDETLAGEFAATNDAIGVLSGRIDDQGNALGALTLRMRSLERQLADLPAAIARSDGRP